MPSDVIRDPLVNALIIPQNPAMHPIGRVSLACELQRDWAREDTVPGVVEIVLTERLLQE